MNIVESLFGRSKTPAERLRQHQRALQKAQRELDRERTKLEQQEKKLVQEIKTSAKQGQMGACKIKATDLVRTRRYIHKFYSMKTQLQAVSLRIQTLRSNQQMAEAMRGATRAMGLMSRQMNIPQMQRIMMEFEKESSMMDMKESMMSDSIDDAMEDEDDVAEGEESDKILKEVLDEIGLDLAQTGQVPSAVPNAGIAEPMQRQAVALGGDSGPSSSSGGAGGGPVGGAPSGDIDALQARLNNLRRD